MYECTVLEILLQQQTRARTLCFIRDFGLFFRVFLGGFGGCQERRKQLEGRIEQARCKSGKVPLKLLDSEGGLHGVVRAHFDSALFKLKCFVDA